MVLHALADHTAIMQALKHRSDPTSPWPEATSVGRWLHDVGHNLENIWPPRLILRVPKCGWRDLGLNAHWLIGAEDYRAMNI